MRLDVVAWGDPIGGLSFKSPRGDGKITARAFTYSEPVQYRGPRLLEIHQTGSGKIAQAWNSVPWCLRQSRQWHRPTR